MTDTPNNAPRQQEAWREALRRKQNAGKFTKQPGSLNPGACRVRNKAAGSKGGIRRQGSKRG